MSYSCNTDNFPRVDSFAKAKTHFDKVKPWRGEPLSAPRPIGTRSHKHKTMRQLSDGSIAFRLYRTDCVIWHPDNTVTVEGYDTMSTTSFISMLVPYGVSHGIGRKNQGEPTLTLRGERPKSSRVMYDPRYPDMWQEEDKRWRAYWNSGMIVRCGRPVRLQCRRKIWLPADPDNLQPFSVPVIDRARARAASRTFNLPTLEKVVNAVIALANLPEPVQSRGGINVEIMRLLKQEDYMSAIALMPRGTTQSFGQRYGTPEGIKPGFLRELRHHIYREFDAIDYVEQRMLTPAQYKRYVRDSNRFD